MDARLDERPLRRSKRSGPGRLARRKQRGGGPAVRIPLVPPHAPLPMPVQDFWSWPGPRAAAGARGTSADAWRRGVVFGLALGLTALFAWKLHQVLSFQRLTPVQAILLVLCTLSFAWIALGSVSALMGFLALRSGRPPDTIELPEHEATLTERTALLFPIYHEDPVGVAAAAEAMAEEIHALGAGSAFDLFVLSDSRSEQAELAEARVVGMLARRLRGRLGVYYRRREVNQGKKAGNIAEWLRRSGADYAHFIVLDADSIMTGRLMVQLSAAMEVNPSAGLIQTVPRLVGSRSLFARLQQFAAGVYGPTVSAGLAWWHRANGNYWGHNAIIRTAAFAASAGLPELPGKPPLGGHIQSHDFIEAALLQRNGWGVHLASSARGSYEGCPPSLVDLVVRDRRWAQGNLQHVRLLRAKCLAPLSRVHLAMGAMAYLVSVAWGLSLAVGLVLALQSKRFLPSYFSDKKTMFPIWPEMDSAAALTLLLATLGVVLLPKLLGVALAVSAPERPRGMGRLRLAAGMLVETLFSMLLAPILMVTQSTAVGGVLAGRDSGWRAQRRKAGGLPLAEIARFHRWHVALGAAVALLCWQVSPQVAGWMGPIILGLTLSIALSWGTALAAPSLLARLLATEEDLAPPPILLSFEARNREWRARLAAGGGDGEGGGNVPLPRAA